MFFPNWKMRVVRSLISLILLFAAIDVSASGKAAIVSAHPLATEVGLKILAKGGTAVDAAIATALVLAVVEPQHSGLGGGGVAVVYDKGQNQFLSYDYTPVVPALTSENFAAYQDTTLKAAETGAFSVATPGFILGLEHLHKKHGRLPWKELFASAIELAETGFVADDKLKEAIRKQLDRFKDLVAFTDTFSAALDSDKKKLFQQKNLALTLTKLSEAGADEFYLKGFAKTILKELEEQKTLIREDDFANFRTIIQSANRFLYKDKIFYTPPYPSVSDRVLQHLFIRAQEQNLNLDSELMSEFLEKQMKAFHRLQDQPAKPPENVVASTTHLCVVDQDGNLVSMTNSLHETFGSGVVLSGVGFVMNNFMGVYDLSVEENFAAFKRRERVAHFLMPLIVQSGLSPFLVMGTTGGKTIPQNIFQTLYLFFAAREKLEAAIEDKKYYVFPEKDMVLSEIGFDDKKRPKNSRYKDNRMIDPVGNTQAIFFDRKTLKSVSDSRGMGFGKVVLVK